MKNTLYDITSSIVSSFWLSKPNYYALNYPGAFEKYLLTNLFYVLLSPAQILTTALGLVVAQFAALDDGG